MPAYFKYQFAIRGTQSTDGNGGSVDYLDPPSGQWSYSGGQTGFIVEEGNKNNSNFDGDKVNNRVSKTNQIGKGNAQTTDIDDVQRQVLWDYTFQVQDPVTLETWDIGVVDVDLDENNRVDGTGESGYYLIFVDGMPPPGVTYNITGNVFDDDRIAHADLGGEVVCFASGTLIETDTGLRAIETLTEGDLVLTRNAGYQPVRWLGMTTAPALGKLAPVVISKGVLGNDSDLVVSQQHAVLVGDWRASLLYGQDDVLVRAVDLLNHDGIYTRPGGTVTYCHLLFDSHQLIRAAGIWSESLYPGDMTRQTVNPAARAEIETLFPDMKGYGPKSARCLRRFEAACLMV